MSDDDYDMMYSGDEMEDYDLDDYDLDAETGSTGSSDPLVIAENQYFEAAEVEDLEERLEAFKKVIEVWKDVPEDRVEDKNWGFKALKRVIKILYQLKRHDECREQFKKYLDENADLLVQNQGEKALTKLLDFLADSPYIKEFFDLTFATMKKKGNKKARLRLELRMTKVLLQTKDWEALEKSLDKMHKDCLLKDGTDDPSKGNQLMDIYAMKIQMYTNKNDLRKLKELYEKSLQIKGICNPRTAGIIHQCGGKMYMREGIWNKAHTDFIEAFKNFDDAGAGRESSRCLKYLVLANMLSKSKINPFDERRAKSYQNKKEIKAMIDLIDAYQENDIGRFEKILKENHDEILGDPFIKDYIEPLMKTLRSQVLLGLIRPYRNISLSFISKELNLEGRDVEELCVELILDNKIRGKIDQIEQIMLLEDAKSSNFVKYRAMQKWTDNMRTLDRSIFNRVN